MHFADINLVTVLGERRFAAFRQAFHSKKFDNRAVMFHPATDRSAAFENVVFIVVSGRARVYLAHDDKEFTLTILKAGDVYTSHTRAYVEAMEATEILVGDIAVFRRGIADVPAFTQAMVRVLGHMLSSAFDVIESLAFKDTGRRLVELILTEAEQSGIVHDDGLHLRLGMTTEQIARSIGATRQTVSTLINDLIRAGVLQKRGRDDYLLPDLSALRRMLEQD